MMVNLKIIGNIIHQGREQLEAPFAGQTSRRTFNAGQSALDPVSSPSVLVQEFLQEFVAQIGCER